MTENILRSWRNSTQSERNASLRRASPQIRKKIYRELRLIVPEDDDWLHWWVHSYLGVWIPKQQVCAEHNAPFEAFADAFFGRNESTVFVIHGSRLFGGKTVLSCVLGLTRAILLGAEIHILGGSEHQAKTMQKYMKSDHENMRGMLWDWKRAPTYLIKGDPTETIIKFINGGSIEALAASQKRTRGGHGTDLFVDEADECEWDVFKSALGQTYSGGRNIKPLTWVTSTWQHPEGTMSQIFEEAEEKGWSTFEWCWRETHEDAGGHVSQQDVAWKKSQMTEIDWLNEVELQRPESGDLIFARETLDALFDPAYGKLTDTVGQDYVFFNPDDKRNYATGTDWAKHRDYTVLNTFVDNPGGPDLVAAWAMRQKEPWPVMIEHHNRRVKAYPGESAIDATGLGDVVNDFLTVDSLPVQFSNTRAISEMHSSFIVACESGEYALPPIPYLKKKFESLTRGQVYESSRVNKKNHTPDPFVAASLARYAKMEGSFELLLGRVG